MIFCLDILLFLNLIFSYKRFKFIISPPVLLCGGMLLASLVATLWYKEWRMETFSFEAFLILGIGVSLYTFFCARLQNKCQVRNWKPQSMDIRIFRFGRLYIFILITILIALLSIHLKLNAYRATFGGYLTIPELIFAARLDGWDSNGELELPRYLNMMSTFSMVVSYMTAWILSIYIFSKKKNVKLLFLLIFHQLIVIFDGALGGAKADVFNPIMRFVVIFMFVHSAKKGSLRMNRNSLLRLGLIGLVAIISFKGMSSLLGRNTELYDGDDSMFAVYCGAEIKNFDLYLQNKSMHKEDAIIGYRTFHRLYKELKIIENESQNELFNSVNGHLLGNVYTQYYPFHHDFGWGGVFLLTLLMSLISMIIYNNALKKIRWPMSFNHYMFIYASIALSIFMAFFSSRFSEGVYRLSFLRFLVYLWIIGIIVNKYLIDGKSRRGISKILIHKHN